MRSKGLVAWFIAWRYLFSHERKALANTITLIAVAGVAVGVAALIVVIGIMDGATVLLFGKMTNLYPHLRVTSLNRGEPFEVTPGLLARIRANPWVVLAEPVIQKEVVIQSRAGIEAQKLGIQLIGMDDNPGNPFAAMIRRKEGEGLALGPREILLGKPVAHKLQAQAGTSATLITMSTARAAMSPSYRGAPVRIKAIFDSGFNAFDMVTAFAGNDEMRSLFHLKPGVADYVYVRLKDPFRAAAVRSQLHLSNEFAVSTWEEDNGGFFSAVKLEEIALFIILLLIILVAALNIIGTLILMVIEKTRQVGILRAVGAGEGFIMRVFLLDGILIGAAGTLVGVVLGMLIAAAISIVKIPMPVAVYNFSYLPVRIEASTVLIIVFSSMAVCTLAGLFPARHAARLNPVEALRYD